MLGSIKKRSWTHGNCRKHHKCSLSLSQLKPLTEVKKHLFKLIQKHRNNKFGQWENKRFLLTKFVYLNLEVVLTFSFFVPLPSRSISHARGHLLVSRFARRTTEKRETARSLGRRKKGRGRGGGRKGKGSPTPYPFRRLLRRLWVY